MPDEPTAAQATEKLNGSELVFDEWYAIESQLTDWVGLEPGGPWSTQLLLSDGRTVRCFDVVIGYGPPDEKISHGQKLAEESADKPRVCNLRCYLRQVICRLPEGHECPHFPCSESLIFRGRPGYLVVERISYALPPL